MYKSCAICRFDFPIEHFHYYGRKNAYCPTCNREDHRVRNEARKQGKDPIEAVRAWRDSLRAAALNRTPSPAPIE